MKRCNIAAHTAAPYSIPAAQMPLRGITSGNSIFWRMRCISKEGLKGGEGMGRKNPNEEGDIVDTVRYLYTIDRSEGMGVSTDVDIETHR